MEKERKKRKREKEIKKEKQASAFYTTLYARLEHINSVNKLYMYLK